MKKRKKRKIFASANIIRWLKVLGEGTQKFTGREGETKTSQNKDQKRPEKHTLNRTEKGLG